MYIYIITFFSPILSGLTRRVIDGGPALMELGNTCKKTIKPAVFHNNSTYFIIQPCEKKNFC